MGLVNMTFTSVAVWFEQLLGDIDVNNEPARRSYPFDLRVGCVKMAAPRHERFDFVRDMGADLIDSVFTGKPFTGTQLTFVFPERHLGVHEQQAFMQALLQNPNIKNIKSLDLITSSALIIGNFSRDSIRILTWGDDDCHNGRVS